MAEKKKNVEEAIDEVAEETATGLSGVKESLAKAERSMEKAKAAIASGAGKARETAAVAAAMVRAPVLENRN